MCIKCIISGLQLEEVNPYSTIPILFQDIEEDQNSESNLLLNELSITNLFSFYNTTVDYTETITQEPSIHFINDDTAIYNQNLFISSDNFTFDDVDIISNAVNDYTDFILDNIYPQESSEELTNTVTIPENFIVEVHEASSYGTATTPVQTFSINLPAIISFNVSGTYEVGETLTANFNYFDANGTYNAQPLLFWYADGDVIHRSFTDKTYTLTENEIGKTISVGVGFYDDAGNFEYKNWNTYSTVSQNINSKATFWSPTYLGELKVGSVISTDISYFDADGNSDNIVLTGWFLDDGNLSNGIETILSPTADNQIIIKEEWVGKELYFTKAFFDDKGNLEKSWDYSTHPTQGLYRIGVIQANEILTFPKPINTNFGPTGNSNIDVVLDGSKWEFSNEKVLDWAIVDGTAKWSDRNIAQQEMSFVFDGISQFIDLEFNFLGFYDSPQEATTAGTEISIISDDLEGGLYGRAHFPTQERWYDDFYSGDYGDVHLNKNIYDDIGYIVNNSPNERVDFLFTSLHEIGHALGLKHPFHPGGGGQGTAEDLNIIPLIGSDKQGEVLFSVMSYSSAGNFANANKGIAVPLTPMFYDIAALQYLYGKNKSHNNDDTIYKIDSDWWDYYANYDTGGTDLIDGSNSAGGLVIELNYQASMLDDEFITTCTNIGDTFPYQRGDGIIGIVENVNGSLFEDIIIDGELHTVGNVVNCFGGNDRLFYQGGNDKIDGGGRI